MKYSLILPIISICQVSAYIRNESQIIVNDPNLGPVTREFIYLYPDELNIKQTPGLIFYLHGWTVGRLKIFQIFLHQLKM